MTAKYVTPEKYAEMTRLLTASRQLREYSRQGNCTLKEKLALIAESKACHAQALALPTINPEENNG